MITRRYQTGYGRALTAKAMSDGSTGHHSPELTVMGPNREMDYTNFSEWIRHMSSVDWWFMISSWIILPNILGIILIITNPIEGSL